MPFSSTPVIVSPGDTVEFRYPTPITWNTSVSFTVRIGEGQDTVTVGTKLPDAKPNFFTFNDQSGSTNSAASLPGDFVSTFERDTFYYSNQIAISGIELRVPIRISSSASGPKSPNFPNRPQAAYSINGGSYITEANSFVNFTGSTTLDSRTITNVSSTTGLAVGMYVMSTNITGEILQISGNTITLVEPASATSTNSSMTGYFTVRDGDTVRLRIRTENWYTTNTNVTLTISDEYWATGNTVSDTWSITTRSQDQTISTLSSTTFTDFVDVRQTEFGTYKTTSVTITGIDADTVLEATSTGDMQISRNQSTWSQNIQDLVSGDIVYIRNFIGSTYTTKTTGSLTIFANAGDTYTRGSVNYENNIAGTWGTGVFAVSQSIGTTTDNQQIWTEVDRYPDPISLSPIFTFSDSLPKVNIANGGAGYTQDQIYTTTALSGSGTGLTIKATLVIGGAIGTLEIVERGNNYTENDIIVVDGGAVGNLCQLIVIQYRTVNVSTTHTLPNAEINRYYYCDIPISGLGTEYPTGTYSNLETPSDPSYNTTDIAQLQNLANTLNARTVEIQCKVTQGAGQIRKNGSGNWVQQGLFLQNGDVLNFRILSSSNYNQSITSSIRLEGPPDGGPLGNPTFQTVGGPQIPTFADLQDTITITTREARTTPYPFRAEPIFNADRGVTYTRSIPISGLDAATTMNIISSTVNGASSSSINALLSADGVNYATSVTVPASTSVIYVQLTSSTSYGALTKVVYEIGDYQDTFIVKTIRDQYTYANFPGATSVQSYFLPQWSDSTDFYIQAAGGGNGGDDLPNSFGGRGGSGNILVGTLNVPFNDWPDPYTRLIRIYSPTAGGNGQNLSQGAAGGSAGWGYATGGEGGVGSLIEYSGGGGGGGGAAAIEIVGLGIVAVIGGGGGGGGAGADTVIQRPQQNGNRGLGGGGFQSSGLATITLDGEDGQDNNIKGGGGGGAGGGWGDAGNINTSLLDTNNGVIGTNDLDADGGTSGGWWYNTNYFTIDSRVSPSELGAGTGEDGYVTLAFPPQDKDPDPFSIVSVSGVDPFTEVYSEYIQITGITGIVDVGITGNGFSQAIRVCNDDQGNGCSAWGNGEQVVNGQYIQARMATGSLYNLGYRSTITVGNLAVNWLVSNGPPPITNPTPFAFTNLTNQPINTLIESDEVIIGSINVPVKVTASNGAEIRIATLVSGSWVYQPWIVSDVSQPLASQQTIVSGQKLQVRILSSSSYITPVTTTVAVGGYTVDWSVTTRTEPDLTPRTFAFVTVIDADPLFQVFSNYAEVRDISDPITFTVSNGAFIELNGVQTGSTTLQLEEFDLIRLYYTTTAVPGESVTFPVTAGTYSTSWTVVNSGDFGTTPDPYTFGIEIAPNPNELTDSDLVTISGITDPNGVQIYGTNSVLLSINGGPFTSYTFTSPYVGASNGTAVRARLLSPGFPGFSIIADIIIGGGIGSFTVVTAAPVPDPILGQWYSSLNVVQAASGIDIKFATKFDGLPVGSMMPVFKESLGSTSDSFGVLDGSPVSRFPGWLYCDGSLVFPSDYPALFSVLGNTYGADFSGRFRLPDMRNKKVVGTGPVNGNSASSPALAPDFGPTKTTSGRSNATPGSHGGIWYISKIDSPSAQVLPQVEEPPAGLTPTESQFFDIGLIRTTGYTNVTGQVDFVTTGSVTGAISLDSTRQIDVPYHQHQLLSGIPDQPTKGRIYWNQNAGYSVDVVTENRGGSQNGGVVTTTVRFNLWGFATQDIELSAADDTVRTSNNPNERLWGGVADAWDGVPSGYYGGNISGGTSGQVTYQQNGLEPGSANLTEIASYIDVGTGVPGGNQYNWIGAVDIPPKDITVQAYRPPERLEHTHYVSLTDFGGIESDKFSYGNETGPGPAYIPTSTPSTTSVNVVFSAVELGLEVLPGQFTLGQTKQLIPTPAFAPREEVPLITPYVWVKWLIKAY